MYYAFPRRFNGLPSAKLLIFFETCGFIVLFIGKTMPAGLKYDTQGSKYNIYKRGYEMSAEL